MPQVVTLSFYRFDGPLARAWAFVQMGLARRHMARIPGIGFWKLCGSGSGEGFTPIPNTAVYAILATWPDRATAEVQMASARPFTSRSAKSSESWTMFLRPTSSWGAWSGDAPFDATPSNSTGPLAALTRATLKPSALARFWARVPDISKVIGNDPSVLFKIGIGEVPWVHQVTFSVWPDAAAMANFARRDGPHARAIKAVREGDWFREELYARFDILGESGSWGGTSPLARLSQETAP